MTLDEIYTPIEEAKKEIERRWNDKELEKKVNEYLDGNIPDVFKKEPKGVCTFHIATPNWAFFHLWMASNSIGLKPLVFEYTEDNFITTNFDKVSLAKMVFYHGKDDNGDMIKSSKHIIYLDGRNEKKKLKDLITLWDENFVDFHHRALNTLSDDVEIYDGSSCSQSLRGSPKAYYIKAFALYL